MCTVGQAFSLRRIFNPPFLPRTDERRLKTGAQAESLPHTER